MGKDLIGRRQEMNAFKPKKSLQSPAENKYKPFTSQQIPIYYGGEISSRIFEPNIEGPLNTLFFFPGTAFIANAPDVDKIICDNLCVNLKCRVILSYPALAPENKYPSPYNNAVAVINHFLQQKMIELNKIALGGYSSGALIALLVCLKSIRLNLPIAITQLILLAPPVNLEAIMAMNSVPDEEVIKLKFFKEFVKNFLPNHIKPEYPGVSPAHNPLSTLQQLPPCAFAIGPKDGIYASTHPFIKTLQSAGLPIKVVEDTAWCHTFPWEESAYMSELEPFITEQFRNGSVHDVAKLGLLPIISPETHLSNNPLSREPYSEVIEIRQEITNAEKKKMQDQTRELEEERRAAKTNITETATGGISPSSFRNTMFQKSARLFNLPAERNKLFIASVDPASKQTYLEEVRKNLRNHHNTTITQTTHWGKNKKCVVSGLGGIGKTQLAMEFCYESTLEYEFIIWINGEKPEQIIQAYTDFLKVLNIKVSNNEPKKILSELNNALAQRIGHCLLVYDNIEKPADLKGIIPTDVDTLITSRNQDWQQKITLGTYQETESVEYLYKATGFERTEQTTTDATAIAQTLDNLPLALAQAAAYIQREKMTFAQYLEDFKSNKAFLMKTTSFSEDHYNSDDHYKYVIYTTWNITINKVKEKYNTANVDTILGQCAFLSPDNIPVALFVAIDNADNIIEMLSTYSMLNKHRTPNNTRVFSIHRLVQSVTAEQTKEQSHENINKLINSIVSLYPNKKKTDADYHLCKLLAPHLAALVDNLTKTKTDTPVETTDRLLTLLSDAYDVSGNTSKQIDVLNNLLKIRIGQYGQEHPKVVEIDSLLGVAYGRLGDYKKRKFIQEQTLKSLKSIHANEPNHPEVIKATAELAISCGKIGEYHRRVELLEEALKEQIALKGDKDPDTLRYQGNLANAYGKLGAHEKRHKLLKATLDEQEKIYEPSDPLLAKTYNSYGNACGKLDDHEQRKVYLEKALAIQTKALGEKHQKTAKTLHNLANNYGNLNNQEKRIELLQQVAKVYPRNHPRQATILADLGDALGKIGEYDKGAKSLLQAIEIQKQRFGETHPKLIKTSIDLAKVYLAQERLYKAQKILQETIIIIEQCKESPKINEQKAKAKKILATITERITQILSGKSGCAQNADASSTMEHNQGQEITPPALMPQ